MATHADAHTCSQQNMFCHSHTHVCVGERVFVRLCIFSCLSFALMTLCHDPLSCIHSVSLLARARMRMSHVTQVAESCHTRCSVMSHTWLSHVTRMNASCCTRTRIISHTCLGQVAHIHQRTHTHVSVMSRTYISQVTCVCESCHIYTRVLSHRHVNKACLVENEKSHTYP